MDAGRDRTSEWWTQNPLPANNCTSFAPETTWTKRNERDRTGTKT